MASRKWVIRKIVEADTLKEALAKEKTAEVLEAGLVVREKEQLTSALATDVSTNDHDYEDDDNRLGF